MLVRWRVMVLAAVLALVGCPKTDQSLILIGGKTLSAEVIDQQPLNVLPSGALLLGTLDAEALFKTNFLKEAILVGDETVVESEVSKALAEGADAGDVMANGLIAGMEVVDSLEVGDKVFRVNLK